MKKKSMLAVRRRPLSPQALQALVRQRGELTLSTKPLASPLLQLFAKWALDTRSGIGVRVPPYDRSTPTPPGESGDGYYISVDNGGFTLDAWVGDTTDSDENSAAAEVGLSFHLDQPGWVNFSGEVDVDYKGYLQDLPGLVGGSIMASMYLSRAGGTRSSIGQTLFWGGDPLTIHVSGPDDDLIPTNFSTAPVPVDAGDYEFTYRLEVGVYGGALGQNPTPRATAEARIDATLTFVTIGFLPKT